jgi:hypothetical protein
MNLLTVDYELLLAIVIGAFALGGFLRGWWREGLTTVLLMLLVILLTQPNIVANIIDYLNDLLTLVGVVTETGGNLTVSNLQAAATTAEPPVVINPDNRNFYILVLVVFLIVAYFTSRRSLPSAIGRPGTYFEPSTGARILGAIVGAFNGFIVVNLVKEYIIGRALPGTGILASTAAPSAVSVQISNVPPDNPFSGMAMLLIGGIGLAIFAVTVWSRYQIEHGAIKTPIPPGYVAVPLARQEKK